MELELWNNSTQLENNPHSKLNYSKEIYYFRFRFSLIGCVQYIWYGFNSSEVYD
jgi:hypothetical protein